MRKPITVLIVDDSALIREMFQEMLGSQSDITVVGTACDPMDAREKIKRLNPDVVTLDIEMPKMDGLSFLEKIMTLRPMPVIMASSLTQRGADATIRALELGAFDYVSKPTTSQNRDTIGALKSELVEKVRAAARANMQAHSTHKKQPAASPQLSYAHKKANPNALIAIGSSTGGVEAVRDILVQLPDNCPPVVITQHMPESFTRSFALRLNSLSRMTVLEASNHQRLQPGHAYIAPGGNCHLEIMKLGEAYVCKLREGPTISGHCPSVDALFHSVAIAAGASAVGVILTGMGRDGAEGLKAMRERGAFTIGQNKASCVVYGMPQVAMKLEAVCKEMPLNQIPAAMLQHFETMEH